MSGNYLRLAGTLQNDRMIASVLLHELTHSWQHAREADNPGMLAQFFKMRFDKREKSWKAVGKAHDDFLKRRTGEMGRAEGSAFKRCLRSQDGAAGAQSLCQARNSALEDGNEREYAELQDEASLSADALYELMSLPSRFGGSTGHDYPFLEPGRTPLDRHAMEDGDEYLAILSQTIWVAPDLASRYYSLREIDWVKREVFGSRPIMPFQPPEGGTLAIQSHLGGGRMTERLDSVTAPAAAFLNNDASRQP
jgi:hypothetical protein